MREQPNESDSLREDAESKLALTPPVDAQIQTAEKILHELQVHQIELEMQNDSLRQSHIELEASRDRFVNFYDNSPVAYITFSREALIAEINLTGALLLGFERPKILKHRFDRFVHPDDQGIWQRHFMAVLQHEDKQSCELRIKRIDGSVMYIQLDSLRLQKDAGPSQARSVLQDITERKQTADFLREQQALFEIMEAMTHTGGWTFYPATGMGTWTKECARIHDLPEDTPINVGAGISYYCEEYRQAISDAVRDVSESGKPYDLELEILSAKGRRKWVRTIGQAILDHGKIVKVYGAVQDITIRKHAEEDTILYVKQLERSMHGTLQAVSNMVEFRDPYTSGHERRVGIIASDIAREMGWTDKQCHNLQMIGLVHDIGKIAIPAEILSKPSRLTPLEYEMVKGHAEKGYEVLKDVEFALPIAEIIHQHHERMDGSGYPRGLKGQDILAEARIIAVADVLESMASYRPYRPALGVEVAIREIVDHQGIWFDQQVVDAVLRLIRNKHYQLPT